MPSRLGEQLSGIEQLGHYIALGVGDVVPSEAQTVDDDMAVVASE